MFVAIKGWWLFKFAASLPGEFIIHLFRYKPTTLALGVVSWTWICTSFDKFISFIQHNRALIYKAYMKGSTALFSETIIPIPGAFPGYEEELARVRIINVRNLERMELLILLFEAIQIGYPFILSLFLIKLQPLNLLKALAARFPTTTTNPTMIFMSSLAIFNIALSVIDELIAMGMSYALTGPLITKINGNPTRHKKDEKLECNICLSDSLDDLSNYCEFPGHVTHSVCMSQWLELDFSTPVTKTDFCERFEVTAGRYVKVNKTCPSCRQPLSVKGIDEAELIRDQRFSGVWKVLLGRLKLDRKAILDRFRIMASSTFAILGFLAIRTNGFRSVNH
ncbi:hypothetical protein HK098_005190 [Nowakowskiella sp. JEL0407]|nr:hypothetical protein HK098_005190 [Nowakowskiella sp. JEL0407]